MIYVALLRGINVGGNNKVGMKILKASFEKLGMKNVSTYINSGNVIFEDSKQTEDKLTVLFEDEIEKEFKFRVKVLIKNLTNMKKINTQLPESWANNDKMKCDVMFLWKDYDKEESIKGLAIYKDVEDVKYVSGVIFWRINKEHASKSKITKIIGTDLYRHMTIRNSNTFKKLLELMLAKE